jgi:hypothetical protein
MITKDTGGAAFPQNTKIVLGAGQEIHQGFMGGMTLRDYFAAKALPSVLPLCKTYQYAAYECYAIADEMLKARKQ